jgi:hypothetical protein
VASQEEDLAVADTGEPVSVRAEWR